MFISVEDVIDLPLIARKFNVDSLHMKANHAASQQMIFVLLTSTCILRALRISASMLCTNNVLSRR